MFHFCLNARNADQSLDTDAILSYVAKITALKDAIYKKAKVHIDKAQEEYKKYYDKKHGDTRVNDNNRLCCSCYAYDNNMCCNPDLYFLVFKPGSSVWLKNSAKESKKGHKMKPHWLGPYKVVKCLDKGVVKIANPKTVVTLKKAVNQCHLKHCYGLDDPDKSNIQPPSDESDSQPPSNKSDNQPPSNKCVCVNE